LSSSGTSRKGKREDEKVFSDMWSPSDTRRGIKNNAERGKKKGKERWEEAGLDLL